MNKKLPNSPKREYFIVGKDGAKRPLKFGYQKGIPDEPSQRQRQGSESGS